MLARKKQFILWSYKNGVSLGFILIILPDRFLMLFVTEHLVNKDLSYICECIVAF